MDAGRQVDRMGICAYFPLYLGSISLYSICHVKTPHLGSVLFLYQYCGTEECAKEGHHVLHLFGKRYNILPQELPHAGFQLRMEHQWCSMSGPGGVHLHMPRVCRCATEPKRNSAPVVSYHQDIPAMGGRGLRGDGA